MECNAHLLIVKYKLVHYCISTLFYTTQPMMEWIIIPACIEQNEHAGQAIGESRT